jgi:hypothetical protein
VGSEGHERNKKHIISLRNLFVVPNNYNIFSAQSRLLFGGDSSVCHMRVTGRELPFVSLDKGRSGHLPCPVHVRRALGGRV